MTILNLMLRGGVLMYILVLISIAALAIIIEKYRSFQATRKSNEKLRISLAQQDKAENIRAVLRIHGQSSPLGLMLDRLYNAHTSDDSLIQQSMESTANIAIHRLEKGMGWLSTFAAIAPLIGFLGTVTGMVKVFMNIQGQNQNSVDISLLAGGIWEALLTTIGGLVVGILTIVFYNDLVQNLENIAKEMQNNAIEHMLRHQKTKNKDSRTA